MIPFFWNNKSKIPVYGNLRTIKALKKSYRFCFIKEQGYKPIMKANVVRKNFSIQKNKTKINIKSFQVTHGLITSTAYVIDKIAYISDCNGISLRNLKYLKKLKYLVIDCLKIDKHPSHFNLDEALNLISITKPKKAILTNLHTDLDYFELKKKLPKNIIPAYDGLSFSF